jgi:hypothetical protein
MKYDKIKLIDLITMVKNNQKVFPKGLETEIYTGDFEGNYTHIKHEIMSFDEGKLFLGYEMHENMGE